MMNRKAILTVAFAALVLLGLAGCVTDDGTRIVAWATYRTGAILTEDGIVYKITGKDRNWEREWNGKGTVNVHIIDYKGTKTDVEIPREIKKGGLINGIEVHYIVTEIGPGAFEGKGLTSVTFPAGWLNNIGDSAFANNNLTAVFIYSIRRIGNSAFANNQIRSVRLGLPNNTGAPDTIGDYAFANNKITGDLIIMLHNGRGIIGNNAFENNEITGIQISGYREIGNNAFANNKITRIHFPENADDRRGMTIGNKAFANNQLGHIPFSSRRMPFAENDTVAGDAFENNPPLEANRVAFAKAQEERAAEREVERQRAEQARIEQQQRDAQARIAEQQRRERAEAEEARRVAAREAADQAEQNRLAGIYRQAGNNTGGLANSSWVADSDSGLTRIDFGSGNYNWDGDTGTFRVQGDTIVLLSNGRYRDMTRIGNSINLKVVDGFSTILGTMMTANNNPGTVAQAADHTVYKNLVFYRRN